MGVSVSLLSAAATSLAVATSFAAGYFISFHYHHRYHNLNDDDENDSNNSTTRNLWTWISRLKKCPNLKTKENKKIGKKKSSKPPLEIESLAKILEDFKMVLVVRNDLKMGKGKIAAQCSHATLGLYKKLHNRGPKALSRWEMCEQVKVVLKIDSEEDMLALQGKAKSLLLPIHITIDAGRTQIAPNSRTVMAILGPADLVDDVTGGLKLL